MHKIFIEELKESYLESVIRGFNWLHPQPPKPSDRIVIKPNLTFPVFRKGVMTNPGIIEAIIQYLKNYTDKISICESDSGGYNKFSMDEVYNKIGMDRISKRYGVKLFNLSNEKSKTIRVPLRFRDCEVPIPMMLLEETDLFITVPVPKVHLNCIASIAVKNQWGIIQQPSLRLKLHPYFKEVIYAINKSLTRSVAIVDGKYGLTRSGPMRGDVLNLNWIVFGDNIFFTDFFITTLMGIYYKKVPYLRYIFEKEKIATLDGVLCNTDYTKFISDKFYLKREWTDYPGVMTFNSRFLAYIGYESIFSKFLHWALYKFRTPFY